ncbi:alpha-tocopherol transfer protein-like isoform X1 [Patella vulgata]|uniref:alpha-tocopherol transfer protein-like isoform X1 n=1 Tax=Patella vulgata TaxID=6465 RepID=UPI00217F5E51|nr:alpha-tocopherol transfer protein-like isoform X1 [Patella vulgata]
METYPPFKSTLSAELLEKAKNELNEDPETRNVEINTLRTRIQSCPGLKSRLDSEFLVRFLRAKKFDQERAFNLVKSYYKIRKDNPEMFKDMVPSAVDCVIESKVTGVLDHTDKQGRKVMIVRPGKWDPSQCPLMDIFKLNYLTLSKLIEDEETQVNGVILMVELGEITWTHAKAISPLFAKRLSALLQEAFPARFKSIHYINEPSFFDYVFMIIKQFLKEKIVKRIHFHGDRVKELHEYIDVQYLPAEFEGQAPAFDTKKWTDHLKTFEDEFRDDLKYGFYDVQAVTTETKNQDAMANSVTGSFRKLDVN